MKNTVSQKMQCFTNLKIRESYDSQSRQIRPKLAPTVLKFKKLCESRLRFLEKIEIRRLSTLLRLRVNCLTRLQIRLTFLEIVIRDSITDPKTSLSSLTVNLKVTNLPLGWESIRDY